MPVNKENIPFHVLVAAAGSGLRFGSDIPKQYLKIHGKTILRHTIENVLAWPGLSSVRVIIDPDHQEFYRQAVEGLSLPEPLHGSDTRKKSINNALNNISNLKDEEIVLVHDAARPFAEWRDVSRLLQALGKNKAASLGRPVSDTLSRQGQPVNREGLWALQTPQAFFFGDLKAAHAKEAGNDNFTDDAGLVASTGIAVDYIEGSPSNIKITTPDDLRLAEALLAHNAETRTGMGFDVHAFDKSAAGKKLVLGGIEIDHDYPLAGHSDADVALHAITDALLGATGAGDIGIHFPPSDPKYKNMDSSIFLKKAVELINSKAGKILHIDLTIICERPKIAPHGEAMKNRIAGITGLEPSRVSIKATTTEGLGFTGRGEGIAAQAVASVRFPCC